MGRGKWCDWQPESGGERQLLGDWQLAAVKKWQESVEVLLRPAVEWYHYYLWHFCGMGGGGGGGGIIQSSREIVRLPDQLGGGGQRRERGGLLRGRLRVRGQLRLRGRGRGCGLEAGLLLQFLLLHHIILRERLS